jgi:hypothetical protein
MRVLRELKKNPRTQKIHEDFLPNTSIMFCKKIIYRYRYIDMLAINILFVMMGIGVQLES